ncbi:hypothetical protein ACJX0J_018822, partial [Zea mays]
MGGKKRGLIPVSGEQAFSLETVTLIKKNFIFTHGRSNLCHKYILTNKIPLLLSETTLLVQYISNGKMTHCASYPFWIYFLVPQREQMASIIFLCRWIKLKFKYKLVMSSIFIIADVINNLTKFVIEV